MRATIKPHQQISFLEAFLGLTLAPSYTSQKLMAIGHRSYAATCIISLLLTLFVPIWAQVIKYRLVDFSSTELGSTVTAVISALIIFYVLGLLLAVLLRLDLDLRSTLHVLTYSLTPVNLGLWLVYGFNYAHAGRLTVVTYVLTGAGNVHDLFFGQLSIAAVIIALWVLLVAYYCTRSASDEGEALALSYALLLAPSIALSLAIGTFVGDIIRPGFLDSVLQLFRLSGAN